MNMFSPTPSLNAYSSEIDISKDPIQFIQSWYKTQNGRVSQALLGTLIYIYSNNFVPDPLNFPSWFVRSLSLFFNISVLILVYTIFGKLKITSSIKKGFILIFGASWLINPTFLYVNNIFDVTLIGYSIPNFVAIGLFVYSFYLGSKNLISVKDIITFACLYLFFSNLSEHNLISAPFLASAGFLAGYMPKKILSFKTLLYLVQCSLLSILSLLIFYFSPAQQKRAAIVMNKSVDLSFKKVAYWLQESSNSGLSLLAQLDMSRLGNYYIFHLLIILSSIGILGCNLYNIRFRSNQVLEDSEILISKLSILGLFFHASFFACMAPSLLSNYLPFYSMQFPCLLLALGLIFSLIAVIEQARFSIANSKLPYNYRPLYILCTTFATLLFLHRFDAITTGFQEIREHSTSRRLMYTEIESIQKQGIQNIALVGFPRNRYTWTIEPQWGLDAYLRWKNIHNLTVIESNDAIIRKVNIQSYYHISPDTPFKHIKL